MDGQWSPKPQVAGSRPAAPASALVAQMAERPIEDREARGSIPREGTTPVVSRYAVRLPMASVVGMRDPHPTRP